MNSRLWLMTVCLTSILDMGCKMKPVVTTNRSPASNDAGNTMMCERLAKLDLHSHRGAVDRPENMLTAFRRGIELGADTIEMDLQVLKSAAARTSLLIVAHDHWVKEECRANSSASIRDRIFFRDLTLDQIKTFDCGSHVKSGQPVPGEKISTLLEVLQDLRPRVTRKGRPVRFNIEVKYNPDLAPRFYPSRDEYAELLLATLDASRVNPDRLLVQSFDAGILRELRRRRPNLRLSILLPDVSKGMELVRELRLDLVTPHFGQVTPEMLHAFHREGVQVIPWTMNSPEDARRMISWGVDGLITDQLGLFEFAASFCAPTAVAEIPSPEKF